MQAYRINEKGQKIKFLLQIDSARTFFSRLAGLIFRGPLKQGEGMLITNCSSIHTCWMRFNIDVIFLDKNSRVIYMVNDMKPFRFTPQIPLSRNVLELKRHTIKKNSIKIGDLIYLE